MEFQTVIEKRRSIRNFDPGKEVSREQIETLIRAASLAPSWENLVLKAAELDLGTLIMGIRDEPAIREYLKIPETETIVAVIAVGYPAAEPSMPKRKAVEEIATFL